MYRTCIFRPLNCIYARAISDASEPVQREPLVHPDIGKKAFNNRPSNEGQQKNFMRFREEINGLARNDDVESIEKHLNVYIRDNPKNHYLSSQLIRQISKSFAVKGDTARCKELLDLYTRLGRHKVTHPNAMDIHAKIVTSFLLSLMNRPDREAAREEVKDYLEKNRNIEKMHTYVRKMLANVLKELGLHQSHGAILGSNPLPGHLLDLIAINLGAGQLEEAIGMLESKSGHVDCSQLRADEFALLAKLLTRMYPKPAYKESATFCGVPTPEVRSFRHIPVPLVKYDTLCKNYELALHIASSQDTKRLIKVIAGRSGLWRQLDHISSSEYLLMLQYTVQLCQQFNITIDIAFWRHLFFGFFKVEDSRDLNHLVLRDLAGTLNQYPLGSPMWQIMVQTVRHDQIPLVFRWIMDVGALDKEVYEQLIYRAERGSALRKQLSNFEKLFTSKNEDVIRRR